MRISKKLLGAEGKVLVISVGRKIMLIPILSESVEAATSWLVANMSVKELEQVIEKEAEKDVASIIERRKLKKSQRTLNK